MSAPQTAARQAALAAELRALYGYALIGPRVPTGDRQLVRDCIVAHTALRDATVTALAAAGDHPVAPRTDYPDLYPVADPAAALDRAVDLEQVCADAWRFLYATLAAAPGSDRASTQRALAACAVRATRWRRRAGRTSPTVPFPGIT